MIDYWKGHFNENISDITIGHEAGHYLGHIDRYWFNIGNITWKGNIMGEFGKSLVEERNIIEIMLDRKNVLDEKGYKWINY